jgi:hypothetical protein
VEVSKDELVALLNKIGPRELSPEAKAALPDPVDIDRDVALLARFGLGRNQLINRFGASP